MTAVQFKERTRNYLHQIKGAFACRAVSMLASFLSLPLMISYLGQEQFGVWSTLITVMSWIVFFDLGIGNGLRNKVTQSLEKNEPAVEAVPFFDSPLTKGLNVIKTQAVIIVANRHEPELDDLNHKVYTRYLFGRDE